MKLYAQYDESGAVRAIVMTTAPEGSGMMPTLNSGHRFGEVIDAEMEAAADDHQRLAELVRSGLRIHGAQEPFGVTKSER